MKQFILSLIISGSLFAQSSFELFEKYIPEKYHNSNETISTFKVIMESIEETDIDLIYHFINAITEDASNNSTEKFKEFNRYMHYRKNEVLKEYNNWLGYQRSILENSLLEEDVKDKALRNFMVDKKAVRDLEIIEPPYPKDENLINFYRMVYYYKLKNAVYDDSRKYIEEIILYENNLINEFRDLHQSLLDKSYPRSISIPKFDAMKKYWYIFRDRINKNDELNQYIVDYYFRIYSTEDEFYNFHVSAVYAHNSLYTFEHSHETPTVVDISFSDDMPVNQFGLAFAYRMQLKKQKSFLSHLKFGINAGYGKYDHDKELEDFEKMVYVKQDSLEYTSNYSVNYDESEYKINSVIYFDAFVAAPVFFLFQDLLIEVGVNLYVMSVDYSLNYSYEVVGDHYIYNWEKDYVYSQGIMRDSGSYDSPESETAFGINAFVSIEYPMPLNSKLGVKFGNNYYSLYLTGQF